MPGLPLPPHDAGNVEREYPESEDQIFHQLSSVSLSEAEQVIAEDNFQTLYCKPVELYNIIQRRSIKKPLFLQRSLRYKIDKKKESRIEITLSLPGSTNAKLHAESIFPLYVMLARPTSNVSFDGHSPIYRFNRVCLLTSFSECENNGNTEAIFIIPDLKNLSTSHSCNLEIIFISSGQVGQTIGEDNCPGSHVDQSSLQKLGGKCSWGKIPINLLASSLENCVNLSLGHTSELASAVTMSPSFLESKFLEHDSCLTFCSHKVDASGSYQLQVCISSQLVGARAMPLSLYNSYSYDDVPPSSLPHIIRSVLNSLRDGNVIFNYKYYNNKLQKTEVTEDFSCPFCLERCGSFKGLRCHLNSSHDIFHFEFWVSENCQAVNVSLKTDVWSDECVGAGVDPRNQTFSYISKLKRCRRLKTTTQKTGHVDSQTMASGSPEDVQVASEDDNVQGENATSVAHSSMDPPHSLHGGSSLSQPTVLQFGKTRKLSAERADPRNRQLLQKRQFFHSHRAQPMALEEVFSERDSEDEVDDDIADLEDRRMLDDFVDVTEDEKLLMHMWNSFVRKQRVIADGHVPWVCEAFSQHHGKQFVQNKALRWGWRMMMIKLWNHGLLDARTMNKCNIILDALEDDSSHPKQP